MQKLFSICALFFLMSCTSLTEPTTTTNDGIEGIWMVYKKDIVSNVLDFHEITFYPNGIAGAWVPRAGLHNYDPNSEPTFNNYRYTFNGTSGINKSGANLEFEEELLLQSKNQLKVGSDLYNRCLPVDGKTLNGSYTSYVDVNDPTLHSLPFGEKPIITFNNDGTFLDEGLFNTAFVLDPQPAPGNGTYEIKNFSIVMKYSDGRIRQCSLHGLFSSDITTGNIIFLQGFDLNKI